MFWHNFGNSRAKSLLKKRKGKKRGVQKQDHDPDGGHIFTVLSNERFFLYLKLSCSRHLFTCNHSIHPLLEVKHANSSTVRTNYFAFSSEISANSLIFFLLQTITQSILKTIQVNRFFQQNLCNVIMFINAMIQDKEFKRLFFTFKKNKTKTQQQGEKNVARFLKNV